MASSAPVSRGPLRRPVITETSTTTGRVSALSADPSKEYVAGGNVNWLQNYARSLSWAIDDITSDFADDVYERMLLESSVASTVNALRAAILEDGATLGSAVESRDKEGYQQAADLVDFCSAALEGMETDLSGVLWNMLDAVAFGNKVAEQVYAYDATYTGTQQLVLRALKVKPRTSTAFVVDSFNNVIGLLGLIPGVGMPVQGALFTSPDKQPNLLPRDKFAILTFRGRDGDPRGTSILRPAFSPWWEKQQIRPQFLKYLTQFAGPSLVGIGPESAQAQPQIDASGNIVLDSVGNPIMVQPLVALGMALSEFQSGTYIVAPFGSAIKPIEMQGEGQAFLNAMDRYDREIVKAILSQTLATEEGQHQAKAAAAVHQDVLDTIVRQAKDALSRMIRRDILTPLVKYNYGDAALRFTPRVTMGRVEERDKTARMQAYAQLCMSYPFTEDQLAWIDALLGLPVRTPGAQVLTGKTVAAPGQQIGKP